MYFQESLSIKPDRTCLNLEQDFQDGRFKKLSSQIIAISCYYWRINWQHSTPEL